MCLFKREENYNSDLEKTEYSYSPAYVMGPGQSFTSNYVAILSGGIKQDVRVLKEDDTSEPIIISPFKYEEVSDGIGEQQLWESINFYVDPTKTGTALNASSNVLDVTEFTKE